jgi:hypothetical protein
MFRTVIRTILAGVMLSGLILAAGTPSAAGPAAACTFDGGGTAVAGSVTQTGDGRAWLCTDDGRLISWNPGRLSGR